MAVLFFFIKDRFGSQLKVKKIENLLINVKSSNF
jgi:hypothetical protein